MQLKNYAGTFSASFWNNRFELTSKQKKEENAGLSFFFFFIVLVYYNSYLLLRNLKSPINTGIFACHNCKILLFNCKILPLLALFNCMTLTVQLKIGYRLQEGTGKARRINSVYMELQKDPSGCAMHFWNLNLRAFVSVLPYTKNAKRKRRFFGYFFPVLLPVFFC